jgi:hypothetical protein
MHINIIGDGMPQQEVIICVHDRANPCKQTSLRVAVLPENENYQLDRKTVLIGVFATIRGCLSELFLSLTRSSNLGTFSVNSLHDGNCKEICYTT